MVKVATCSIIINPSIERYYVLLNNGHTYYFAAYLLQLTQPPAEAVQLPPMQKHPLPARVAPGYRSHRRFASTALNQHLTKRHPEYFPPCRDRSEAC